MSFIYPIERHYEIDSKLERVLSKLTTTILSYLPRGLVRRIVHYGSSANGTADSDSDIDIAVFVDENEIWRSSPFSYDHSYGQKSFQDRERRLLKMDIFYNHLDQKFHEPEYSAEKFSIFFVTPQDLGFFSWLTESSPKGKWSDAWLNGRDLHCDSQPGWWHRGEGIEFIPTNEDELYRALLILEKVRIR